MDADHAPVLEGAGLTEAGRALAAAIGWEDAAGHAPTVAEVTAGVLEELQAAGWELVRLHDQDELDRQDREQAELAGAASCWRELLAVLKRQGMVSLCLDVASLRVDVTVAQDTLVNPHARYASAPVHLELLDDHPVVLHVLEELEARTKPPALDPHRLP